MQLALAKAGMIEGKPVGEKGVAVAVAAEATLRRWSAEFSALQVTQRPTFVLTNDISDRYVLSARIAPAQASFSAGTTPGAVERRLLPRPCAYRRLS